MADRDALTQLWNRETFDLELAQAISDAAGKRQLLSLIMADIEHFKGVNDTHGHQTGDAVLTGGAACIVGIVEGKGRAYRYGGEEIAIILTNHDTQAATAVAERVRRGLESARIVNLTVTASLGVGTCPDHGRTSTELVRAADTALYDARNRGRNLVRIFQEPAPTNKSREPERKLPEPGALTEEQRLQLRQQYFRSRGIRCPRDAAVLSVEELTTVGSTRASLVIWCKMCGLTEEL